MDLTAAPGARLATKAGARAAAPPRPIPPFTAEHERLRAEIRDFVLTRLRPHADEWEAAEWFPNDVFRWLAQAGYLGLKFPVEYGGSGDTVAAAVLAEELARCGSGGVAAGLGAHIGIALPPISAFGSEEQKQRYLVPGIRGEKIAALAITEPGAGSDVASIRTHAEKVDGGYLVNGNKTFITGGVRADVLVTAVRTKPGETRPDPSAGSRSASRATRRPGTTESRFCSSRPATASPRAPCASSVGTPPTPPRSRSMRCSSQTRTCLAPSTEASI